MAHTDKFSSAALKEMARHVGLRLKPHEMPADNHFFIGETFSEWMLPLNNIADKEKPFADLVAPTGRWHHQIKSKGGAEFSACSVVHAADLESPRFAQLNTAAHALKVEKVIHWIDKNVPGDPTVRLLAVPAFHIHAFWLKYSDHDQIVLIDHFGKHSELREGILYDATQFLQILSEMKAPAGIPSTRPKSPASRLKRRQKPAAPG